MSSNLPPGATCEEIEQAFGSEPTNEVDDACDLLNEKAGELWHWLRETKPNENVDCQIDVTLIDHGTRCRHGVSINLWFDEVFDGPSEAANKAAKILADALAKLRELTK